MSISEEWNWVTARNRCSIFEVFKQLQRGVEDDVATREQQTPADVTFKMREDINPRPDNFAVLSLGKGIEDSREFSWSGDHILVRDTSGNLMVKGRITLTDDRQCRLKVGDRELECWQFRKEALEVFFRF